MGRCKRFTTALALGAIAAHAHSAQRTFVAPTGIDTPTCSIAAPCRTFTGALAATDPGGEIVVLESGGYGRVSIDKSVAIIAPPGVYAGITVFPGTNGIDILTADIKVSLRGLTINGQGGDIGINYNVNLGELNIENCVVANMAKQGIQVAGPTRATITDTVTRGNGGFGATIGGFGYYVLDNVRAEGNVGGGLQFAGYGESTVSRSLIANNVGGGIEVREGFPIGDATLAISDTTITQNAGFGGVRALANFTGTKIRVYVTTTKVLENYYSGAYVEAVTGATALLTFGNGTIAGAYAGIWVKGNGTVTGVVSGSQLVRAGIGLQQEDSAVLYSRGDNVIAETPTPTSGTITPLSSY